MTRESAWTLLTQYNQEPFHLEHAQTVEGVMRWYAEHLGYGEETDFWGVVGLLHDLDFERWPEEHCVRSQVLMREAGIDERIIHATASHGWGMTDSDCQPEHEMEKVLFAVDELTGLIGAAARMRPTGLTDMELSSLKKKFKDKRFAAGCSRDVIRQGAELLGWELDKLLETTLEAMKTL